MNQEREEGKERRDGSFPNRLSLLAAKQKHASTTLGHICNRYLIKGKANWEMSRGITYRITINTSTIISTTTLHSIMTTFIPNLTLPDQVFSTPAISILLPVVLGAAVGYSVSRTPPFL